jgi:molybdate transport system substrate-binding protein
VFAASSLTEAFTALEPPFEDAHPSVDVVLNFAGSATLARQIAAGGPADVFVAADEETMEVVLDARRAEVASVIARNRVVLLVAPGNPLAIDDVADLAAPDLVVVTCAPEVPCGRLAAEALQRAGLDGFRPTSLERNVKAVVTKVTLGEADAGLVYATDVQAAGPDAEGVEIDGSDDASLSAVYVAAVMSDTPRRAAAEAWVALLGSDQGKAEMARFGFEVP